MLKISRTRHKEDDRHAVFSGALQSAQTELVKFATRNLPVPRGRPSRSKRPEPCVDQPRNEINPNM